jgi:hypothetical protein
MKICTKCKEELSLDMFPIKNNKTGQLNSMCVDCKREYDREYWEKNKDKKGGVKREHANANRIIKRKYIIDVLKKSSCCDCNNSDWRVLEFDHRDRETKSFNIADSTSYSIDRIQEEIDKCDIVCANCHNIRTIEQRGYYKFI